MVLIRQAARLACKLHEGQKRAGGEPYIYHPMRVAGMLTMLDNRQLAVSVTDDMIAAAWLHDVYEDTDWESPALNAINPTVERLVDELTNRFTKQAYPKMNRRKRKVAETKRLTDVSPQAQIIKLCDRIDNLQTIREKKGKKFHLLYCDESEALADVLTAAPHLQLQVYQLVKQLRDG